MAELNWDQVGEREFETGVDRGVLYLQTGGVYDQGFAWNGLVNVTESPTGAESNKQYADNIVYVNILSAEEFGATVEAFMSPPEFDQCDGSAEVAPGVTVGQQNRRTFGFCYRTRIGNDLEGTDYGYKLHLVWGATAAPSERAYGTINESPEATNLSWELSTSPVAVPGTNPVTGKPYRPTATMTIRSTEVDAADLAELEDILYGTVGADPRLPLPAEVIAIFTGALAEVTPEEPTYVDATDTLTIPAVVGVEYRDQNNEVLAAGNYVLTADEFVTAFPLPGYKFPANVDTDWSFDYTP